MRLQEPRDIFLQYPSKCMSLTKYILNLVPRLKIYYLKWRERISKNTNGREIFHVEQFGCFESHAVILIYGIVHYMAFILPRIHFALMLYLKCISFTMVLKQNVPTKKRHTKWKYANYLEMNRYTWFKLNPCLIPFANC